MTIKVRSVERFRTAHRELSDLRRIVADCLDFCEEQHGSSETAIKTNILQVLFIGAAIALPRNRAGWTAVRRNLLEGIQILIAEAGYDIIRSISKEQVV